MKQVLDEVLVKMNGDMCPNKRNNDVTRLVELHEKEMIEMNKTIANCVDDVAILAESTNRELERLTGSISETVQRLNDQVASSACTALLAT